MSSTSLRADNCHAMLTGRALRLVSQVQRCFLSPRLTTPRNLRFEGSLVETAAVGKEEAQLGEVDWTKDLVNCVSLTGYLSNRLMLISTQRSPLAKGQLKVLGYKGKPAMYVDLEIWGDLAHTAADHLMQGDHIQVVGKLKKNVWTKRDGTEKQDVSISLTKVNRIINSLPRQEFGGDTAPWDDVSTSQDQYGGHAMGESFMEDQTQGVPGWEEAEPAYPANPGPPAQGDVWADFMNDMNQYDDFRQQKQAGSRSFKFPDFKHRVSGKALWLNSAPQWVKDELAGSSAERSQA